MKLIAQKSIIMVSLLMLLLVGCGGGKSTSSEIVDTTAKTTLQVSQTEVAPGTFIVIEDSSIKNEEEVDIKFNNSSGFEVILAALPTENGRVSIPVPFNVNENTGDIEEGNLTISISNGKQATLRSSALPELSNTNPGDILKSYLKVLVENYNTIIEMLNDFETSYGYDTGELVSEIQIQIDTINNTLHELNTTGSITSSLTSAKLSQKELRGVDQLLYAISLGLFNELYPSSLSDQTKIRAKNLNEYDELESVKAAYRIKPDTLLNNLSENMRASTARHDAMNAAGKALAREYGGAAGEYVFSNSKLLEASELTRHIVNTVAQESINKMRGKEAFIDETRESRWAIAKKIDPTGVLSLFDKIKSLKRWIEKKCKDSEVFVLDYSVTCSGIKDRVSHTELAYALFEPQTIQLGKPGVLTDRLDVNTPYINAAKNNVIFIDWGDKTSAQIVLKENPENWFAIFGNFTQEHTYLDLPNGVDEKYFTITVTASGDNDLEYSSELTSRVLVKKEILPLAFELVNAPSILKIDESGDWKFNVSGGAPPYFISVDWDDDEKNYGNSSSLVYKGSHSYKTSKTYYPTFKVRDSNKSEASTSSTVYVVTDYGIPIVKIVTTDANADESGDTGVFEIIRKGDTSKDLTVYFALAGRAKLNDDYTTPHSSSITIPAGAETVIMEITPVADLLAEGDETVVLTINENPGYFLESNNSGSIVIGDKMRQLVFDRIIYSQYPYDWDSCEGDNCMRETIDKFQITGEENYTIGEGTAEYKRDTLEYPGGQGGPSYPNVSLTMQFKFDTPPQKLIPGETIPLTAEGTVSGFTIGMFLSRTFHYQVNNNYYKDTQIYLYNRDLPYDELTGKFEGSLAKPSQTTNITIPENAGDDFTIWAIHGQDPSQSIGWVYKVAQ